MPNRVSEDSWSVVLYSSSEDCLKFGEKAESVIGRRGLSFLSLIWFQQDHLPAELCGGLSEAEARRIANELNTEKTSVKAELTSELTGLKHKAEDIWASRCTDSFCFTEVDGLITILGRINARENIQHLRMDEPLWYKEYSLNHMHILIDGSDSECIDEGDRLQNNLQRALQEAYPEHKFTISHELGSIVSFWQTDNDSPTGDYLPVKDNQTDKAFCRKCGKYKNYEIIDYIDNRFPKAEWGRCEVCGSEILTQTYIHLIHINSPSSL